MSHVEVRAADIYQLISKLPFLRRFDVNLMVIEMMQDYMRLSV